MDRRTFTRTLAALGLGLVACGRDGPLDPGPSADDEPEPFEPRSYETMRERALGVADGILASAEPDGDGLRWPVLEGGATTYPTDLYTGQVGVLAFLAAAYRYEPGPELRDALERGGRWLRSRPIERSYGLFDGLAGRAWAFLDLYDALDDPAWLEAAQGPALDAARWRSELAGDLINGDAGQILLLIRMAQATGDAVWLDAACTKADRMLDGVVPSGEGIKFPSFALPDGGNAFYTGLAHGTAGAGYALCRLAAALPEAERGPYRDGAEAAARWLKRIARPAAAGVNWYRREPDQLDQVQVQWCHGAPGIGLFFTELLRLTADAAHLETAERCAALVAAEGGAHWSSCQCHGVAGNTGVFFKLFRTTGEARWLDAARAFEPTLWRRRYANRAFPVWPSGDGNATDNPGLMTGTAGVGWYYLQLAQDGALPGPVTV